MDDANVSRTGTVRFSFRKILQCLQQLQGGFAMSKILGSLKKLLGRFKPYMAPTFLSVGTTFVMVGFVVLLDATTSERAQLWSTILIITGLVMTMASMLVAFREEHQRKREGALLLTLATGIAERLGVDMKDLAERVRGTNRNERNKPKE
jgi:hypothetical protein